MASFRFKLSGTLIEKLCMVQFTFRKNSIPDDVFWYMIKLSMKIDMHDVCVYDDDNKNFVSMFEYGPDLKIKVRDKWNMLDMDGLKRIYENTHKWNSTIGFVQKNKLGELNIIMQYREDTYTIFTFSDNILKTNLCCVKFNEDSQFTWYDDKVNDIIERRALLLFSYYRFCQNFSLIEFKHLKLLKQKFNIQKALFMDC